MPRTKYKPNYSDGDPFPGYYALVECFYYKGHAYCWDDLSDAYYNPFEVQFFEKVPKGSMICQFYKDSKGRKWFREQSENEASHD